MIKKYKYKFETEEELLNKASDIALQKLNENYYEGTPMKQYDDIERYIRMLAKRNTEQAFVVCINAHSRISSVVKVAEGTDTSIVIQFPLIAKAVFQTDCTSYIMVHTHPGASNEPSAADEEAKKQLYEKSAMCGLYMIAFMIVGYEKYKLLTT